MINLSNRKDYASYLEYCTKCICLEYDRVEGMYGCSHEYRTRYGFWYATNFNAMDTITDKHLAKCKLLGNFTGIPRFLSDIRPLLER